MILEKYYRLAQGYVDLRLINYVFLNIILNENIK